MRGLISIGILNQLHYNCSPHSHDEWEIIYYTKGMGTNTIDDELYTFEKGSIICQPPGIIHYEHSDDGYSNIHFCVQYFDDLGIKVPCFTDSANMDFYKILMLLHYEFHAKRNNCLRLTECLLEVLYEYMHSFKSNLNKNLYVEKFERLLISNMSCADFDIAKAMEEIPLCPGYFRRIFKAETGKTPLEYLTEQRINHAKQLLSSKYESIKYIAYLSGYDDPYYFSRVFRKVTGMYPTAWQRTLSCVVPTQLFN